MAFIDTLHNQTVQTDSPQLHREERSQQSQCSGYSHTSSDVFLCPMNKNNLLKCVMKVFGVTSKMCGALEFYDNYF